MVRCGLLSKKSKFLKVSTNSVLSKNCKKWAKITNLGHFLLVLYFLIKPLTQGKQIKQNFPIEDKNKGVLLRNWIALNAKKCQWDFFTERRKYKVVKVKEFIFNVFEFVKNCGITVTSKTEGRHTHCKLNNFH